MSNNGKRPHRRGGTSPPRIQWAMNVVPPIEMANGQTIPGREAYHVHRISMAAYCNPAHGYDEPVMLVQPWGEQMVMGTTRLAPLPALAFFPCAGEREGFYTRWAQEEVLPIAITADDPSRFEGRGGVTVGDPTTGTAETIPLASAGDHESTDDAPDRTTCPGCGRRIFGEVAARGICTDCAPTP